MSQVIGTKRVFTADCVQTSNRSESACISACLAVGLIVFGDMSGPPGGDSNLSSPALTSVALAPHDTVRDAKKKLIIAAAWTDELPEDFGLFHDISEDPLNDAITLEFALSDGKLPSMGNEETA